MPLRHFARRCIAFPGNVIFRLVNRLPSSRASTRIITFFQFIRYHKRLPRRRNGTFLDFLFYLKYDGELLSLPRQIVSDKEYGKFFVNSILGGEFTIPTIEVLRSRKDVRDFIFPHECVIKPTNGSGKVIIRKNGEPIDLKTIYSWFDFIFYMLLREENYKYLENKVIVEPIVFGNSEFFELNVQCYEGRVKILLVICGGGLYRERRDRDWNVIDIGTRLPSPDLPVPKPECWDRMLWAAESIASRFRYIRVDFYCDGKDFFIGELTNCSKNMAMNFHCLGDELKYSKILFGRS